MEVEGAGTYDVEEDKRLVLAIEEDAGVDIMHSCERYKMHHLQRRGFGGRAGNPLM